VHAGARLAPAFQPAVAQAQNAVDAEQVLDEAKSGGLHHDVLEHRIVPKHEAHQFLAVGENLGQCRLVALLALAGDAQEGVANGFMLLGWPCFVGWQHGEPERFEFCDVFNEVELFQFAVERRECLRGRPVLNIHSDSNHTRTDCANTPDPLMLTQDRSDKESMQPLTDDQKRNFVRDGFLHVPGVVPPRLLARARRAINHSLGAGIDRNDVTRLNAQSFCGELRSDPRLLRLATTPAVWAHVRALLGERRTAKPQRCQIALRFPRPEGVPRRLAGPHIDGYHTPENGVPDDGVVRNFTLLLGIMLSEVPAPFSGNFTVWPGTHRRMERYFRDHGVNSLQGGEVGTIGLRLPKSVAVTGNAGDLILAHHQVVHGACLNASPNVRLATITRLKHKDTDEIGKDAYTNIWREWPGIRDVLS